MRKKQKPFLYAETCPEEPFIPINKSDSGFDQFSQEDLLSAPPKFIKNKFRHGPIVEWSIRPKRELSFTEKEHKRELKSLTQRMKEYRIKKNRNSSACKPKSKPEYKRKSQKGKRIEKQKNDNYKIAKKSKFIDIEIDGQQMIMPSPIFHHTLPKKSFKIKEKQTPQKIELQQKRAEEESSGERLKGQDTKMKQKPINLPEFSQQEVIKHLEQNGIHKREDLKILKGRMKYHYGKKQTEKLWRELGLG